MQKRALVVGLGIAGMSAAIGLRRAGWTPVIVERAPERRTGGYFVGLFPEGRQAALDLGIAEHLHTRNPERADGGGNVWSVDCRGRRRPALGFLDQPGEPAAVLRGDIEAALWQSTTDVEVRFGTTPVEITEGADGVRILLEDAGAGKRYQEDFALVVGADGMRSSVRRIVFGPHEKHLTTWNAMICAFQLKEQVPTYGASDSIIIARAKRAVWVFGLADHAPTALLTYRTKDFRGQFSGSRVERLRVVYSGMDDDPVVRHVLDSLEEAPDHVFDSVHQVRMPRWSRGRVVLVGDAALVHESLLGHGRHVLAARRRRTGRGPAGASRRPRRRPGHLGVRPASVRHQAPAHRATQAADVRPVQPSGRDAALGPHRSGPQDPRPPDGEGGGPAAGLGAVRRVAVTTVYASRRGDA
ncbi:2-polyprenyl-6-methoxyphenol hydroxylase-like FAD-dependent oxidoreductase [Streptomyces ambofaciens]